MSPLRRRKTESDTNVPVEIETPAQHVDAPAQPTVTAVPPHIERALITLTTQMQQCVERLDSIDTRLDELAENLANVPSHSDVLEVRIHSAKLAAELARATVELRGEIGMASDEARRAARLARTTEPEEVPVALPVDLDLTAAEEDKPRKRADRQNWSESA